MATKDQVYHDTPAREQSRILHETAVEERLLGRIEGATQMRERAAKLVETAYEEDPPHAGWEIAGRYLAKAIRALPLDPDTGGE